MEKGQDLCTPAPKSVAGNREQRHRSENCEQPERGRGDLLISIKVKTPKRLSRRAKQLMEELKEEVKVTDDIRLRAKTAIDRMLKIA